MLAVNRNPSKLRKPTTCNGPLTQEADILKPSYVTTERFVEINGELKVLV
jgi:hypothetical protein